ncbi:MAG: YdcF family protein [Meiothermus sp.]
MRRVAFWIGVLLALGLSIYAIPAVYILSHANQNTAKPSDAVLVLGAKAYIDRRVNPCLEGRVQQGVKLVQDGLAKYLIVSGGHDIEDGRLESATMAQVARRLGLHPEQIVQESIATSTYQNLLYSSEIMRARGWSSVILVSQAFHLPRAALTAEKLGLEFSVSPVQNDPCPAALLARARLREPIALLAYWLLGKG